MLLFSQIEFRLMYCELKKKKTLMYEYCLESSLRDKVSQL